MHDIESITAFVGELLKDAVAHDGYSDVQVSVRILKKGQKEVVVHYGRQYRFVIDQLPAGRLATQSRRYERLRNDAQGLEAACDAS